MMGRNTRLSTTRLWTGIVTLLLISGFSNSQGTPTLSDKSSLHTEAIAERSPGSVVSLRNVNSRGDVPSTTLKNFEVVPEATIKDTVGDELLDSFTAKSNETQKEQSLSDNNSEKLKIQEPFTKVASIQEKRPTNEFLPEFSENEDNEGIEDLEDDNDREPTTLPPKKGVNKDPKHKEKEAGGERSKETIPDIGISLMNDTNVNYNDKKHVKDAKDERVFGKDSNGPKTVLENATNVIASGTDAADGQEKGKGPKAEVEVVKNSALPKVLRITNARVSEEKKEVDGLRSAEQESVETIESTVIPESKQLVDAKEKTNNLTLVTGDDIEDEKTDEKKTMPSPKGRTISFGGTNEFIAKDNKTEGKIQDNYGTTDRSSNQMLTDLAKEPAREEKSTDFKPYPYAKTNHQSNSSEISSSGNGRIPESTEETAALENTIGQGQQNKKFVVTEPSVVIDNSIQHFKPTYYKRSGNSTRIPPSSSITMPTVPSVEDGEKFATTLSSKSIALDNNTTLFVSRLPILNTENDVPRGQDEAAESSVGFRDTSNSLDLTGNGITEVITGIKNDSVIENSATTASTPSTSSSISKSRASEKPLVQNSTEKVATTSEEVTLTNIDSQTDPTFSMIASNQNNTNVVNLRPTFLMTTLMPDTSSQPNSTPETSSISTLISSKTSSTSPLIPESVLKSTPNQQSSPASTSMTETSTMPTKTFIISTNSNPLGESASTSIPTMTSMLSKVTFAGLLSTELENQTSFPSEESTVVSIHPTTLKTAKLLVSDEPVESTTSKIEYIFVGLTESTASEQYLATSESSNAMTLDREFASQTPSSLIESSTLSETSSVVLTTLGISSNSSEISEVTENPEQTSAEPVTLLADNDSSEDSTSIGSFVESTTLEDSTVSKQEYTIESTTTDEDTATTLTDEFVEAITDEVTPATNSTNLSGVMPDRTENTTHTGRAVDSSTSIPDVTGTVIENSSETSTGSPGPSNISITSEVPEISEPEQIPNTNVTLESPRIFSTSVRSSTDVTPENPNSNSTYGKSSTKPMTSSEKPDMNTTAGDTPDIASDDSIEIATRGVPSLVKVIFEGSWADVCPHLDVLRQSLADLLTSGLGKTVLASQIVFQNNPCSGGFAASTMSTESSVTTLLLYVVDEKGNFDSEMTKTLPSLYSKSPIKLQVNIRSFQLVQDSDSGNAIAVIVVSCVALICLVVLAGLLFIMRKRQTRFNYGERCRPVSLDAYSLDSVSAYNSVRRKGAARASKRSYGNPTFEDSSAIPSHPLNFAGLSTFCNEQNTISEEFAGIPQVTARIDELPQGAEVKNRYANVVPLPETRVSLIKLNNDPLTEYINASYVRGPKNATKYYIACQAPIESTVTDFWRMIWEQQSKVVIMLTDLVENGVEKCAEYIPPSEVTDCHRLFGDFQVTLKKRETKEKYAISTLHLKNLENNTFREISHIWYLWPANGVQSDAAGLIAVLLEARALQRGGPGPIVVHCSPGTGRTGTLIALDLGIRQYEITRTVDVPRVVYTIRRDRAGAVQTKEQYAFIYKALNLYATKLAGGALES